MTHAVPVSATTNDLDEPESGSVRAAPNPYQWWIEAVPIGLLAIALFVGLDSWRDWFSSVDRVICSVCVLIGLSVAFARSNWKGEISTQRFVFAVSMWAAAVLLIVLSFAFDRPRLSGIACGMALAGWCSLRIRGESLAHSIMLGLVFAIPTAIDAFAARGAFDWLESIAINVTSGIADTAEQSHVREDNKLIFGLGVADRFSCVGKWDSAVSFFGIAIFCVLAFRRNLVAGLIAIVLSAFVWIAVRAAAWVGLAILGIQNGVWYEWSLGLEIGVFVLGAIMVVSLDQFVSALLEPIPFEFINTDFPLFAFIWNWLAALPTLTVSVPQRESDFGSIEGEDEYDEMGA